ncbi:Protein of unknown function (DUF1014) domain containing protein [Lactarius tabidus]
MAPKGGNTKKESGRAKKAENEAIKRAEAAEAKERTEVDKWADGAKSSKSKQDKEEKRKAELERKAENARLLAEEEASQALRAKKAAAKAIPKKGKPKPAGPGAIDAGGELSDPNLAAEGPDKSGDAPQEVESFAATGIDNAIDLLEVVTAKMDKASVGNQAAGIEKHPERRFKAAFNAYVERELPNIREEQPGLRLQQYRDLLFKQFQKSPENPFNQATVEYNATNEEKVEVLRQRQDDVRERLREKSP